MSAYTDMIEKHSVYTKLTEVYTEIDAVKNMQDKPSGDVEAIARIAAVIKNFEQALDTCDKSFILAKWLDDVSTAINLISGYLRNYRNNKTSSYLTSNSYTQLETVLQSTVKLNCIKSKQTLVGYARAVEEYKEVMDAHNEQLAQKVLDLGSRVEELKKSIENNDQTALQSLNELKTAIAAEKQRLDGIATTYQNQMVEDRKTFLDAADTMRKEFDGKQGENQSLFEQKMAELNDKNNGLIETFEEKFSNYAQQIEELVGTMSANVYSARYKTVADSAHKSARIWHIVTVVLLLFLVGYAVFSFVITTSNDTSWIRLIAKIFATTTLVSGAAYAARQASKQEKVERYARNMEMQLVAFDPFIATLDDEKRAEIKEEMARKIFGNPYAMEISRKDESYVPFDKIASMNDSIDKLAEFVEKL